MFSTGWMEWSSCCCVIYLYIIIFPGHQATGQLVFALLLGINYFNFRFWIGYFPGYDKLFAGALLLIGIAEMVWGSMQLYGWAEPYHHLFRISGSFFNPGPYRGLLGILLPLALFVVLKKDNRVLWLIGWIFLVGALAVLPCTMSRTAWIAATAGCLYVACTKTGWLPKYARSIRLHRARYVATGLLILCMTASVGYAIFRLKQESAYGRVLIWKLSGEQILQSPAGSGIGSFAQAFGNRQADYFASGRGTPAEANVAGNPSYGFNEFLETGVELGVPGLLLFVSLFGVALHCAWQNRTTTTGYAGALWAWGIFGMASYPLNVLPLAICFVLLLAGCVSCREQQHAAIPQKQTKNTLLFTLGAILALVLACSRYPQYSALKEWNTNRYASRPPITKSQVAHYEKLYRALYDLPDFLFEYGKVLEQAGDYLGAASIFRQGQRFSCDPMFYNLEGKCWQALKKTELAAQSFAKAHYLVPSRLYPSYLLAKLYEEAGQTDLALHWARQVIDKKVKIKSSATREMQDEMKQRIAALEK